MPNHTRGSSMIRATKNIHSLLASKASAVKCFLVLVAFVRASAVLGQHPVSSQISLSAGSATDINGLSSRAASISPSLGISVSPRISLAFAASGTHFEGGGWSFVGGAGALVREPLGPLAVTLDARTSFTETSYNLSHLIADMTPAVEARWRSVTLFAGAHASGVVNWAAETPLPGHFSGFLPRSNERLSTTRLSHAVVYGANMNLAVSDRASVIVGIREERGRVVDAAQLDRTITATATRGSLSLGGSAGNRVAAGIHSLHWSASLSVPVAPAASFNAGAGRYPANHLTGAAAGRFVNAGFSLRLGERRAELPKPANAPRLQTGMTRLAIEARNASRVEVAGDFTNWQLRSTERSANGVWYVDLRIPPGVYRYAFRIDGSEWQTPEGAATADDGYGGRSALLRVGKSEL